MLASAALLLVTTPRAWAQSDSCSAPANAIVAENCLPGAPASEWDVQGSGADSIQGFATDISVDQGQTVSFKVDTDARDYRLDIYRMGYYGGLGARRVATVQPSVALPQSQPPCLSDPATGLVDCGNWAVSATWQVPAEATSGIYFARLVREDGTVGASHIVFVVRDDDGASALLFQTADTTWQAYNRYGGSSLYVGSPAGRAYKVSYNRPFTTREYAPEDWVFNAEYPMVRWLEANGYDVSYTTGVDTDRRGAELREHRVFLSVGHDEYWSGDQRASVEAARDAGTHLAFFSGNEVFWKTRWEPSIDGSGASHRTLVCYKETHAGTKLDPAATVWTGTWRDARAFNPEGPRPENALTGTLFTVNCCTYSIQVPAEEGRLRLWRNTSIAGLATGQTATLPAGTLGYEWDEDVDNGLRPPGLVRLSSTRVDVPQRILDFGSNYGQGEATHSLTLYKHASGALVFGAGTVQWAWGLDATHDRGGADADVRMQQATVNLLADMGVQPGRLQAGLVPATASSDAVLPVATFVSPVPGATVAPGEELLVRGSASDVGGRVAGVEVSVDGGASWRPAHGRDTWSLAWTPTAGGTATLQVRAVDDSGNIGAASTLTVHVGSEPPAVEDGPGGPILVVAHAANPFSRYYAEVLRAEGLNLFSVRDLSTVTAPVLAAHDVVVLGEGPLDAAQVDMLSSWVQGGGRLIAMRPGPELAGLLGLASAGGTLTDAYLRVDTTTAPGAGIVGETLQFHGPASRYTLAGASALATLYSSADVATGFAAVTLRSVGTQGGLAAAFTYDLARSVVYTRQGNPAWAGQERDGVPPVRSNDLFFGGAAFDPQPDWVDLSKVAIPQADEQQRLLANLILHMNRGRKPLPRFWYLPRGERAVVVMTGDDHAGGGTDGRWQQYQARSPLGCSVAQWECVRATSYVFVGTDLTDAEAAAFQADGFEVALHVNTGCQDFTPESYASAMSSQLAEFASRFPSVAAPVTNRNHCIAFSDWATVPRTERANGIRLDTNYYYWPPDWLQDRPGLFTGSGMPMRFADVDGTLIDVYQATTQLTDESGQSFPFTIDTLLDRALGPEGYYGVFVANMHTDADSSFGSDAIIASAQARGVPVVSSRQMLEWLDGRNGSSFGAVTWSGSALSFDVAVGTGASGLQGLVPAASVTGPLSGIRRNGASVSYVLERIKGVEYAVFPALAGSYVVTYAQDTTAPVLSTPVAGVSGGAAVLTWTSDEPADSQVQYGTSPDALTLSAGSAALTTSHAVTLTGLAPGTAYHFRVSSADASGNRSLSPAAPLPPSSFTTPAATETPGLVAAYAFGEGVGSTAADVSGGGHTATLGGASWTAEGRYGGALSFDGVDDWLTVADAAALDLTTGMTLEAWVRPSALQDWTTVVMKERSGGLAWALYGSDSSNRPPVVYAHVGGDQPSVGTTSLPLGQWSHLAATYDGATLRLYVNGAQVASRSLGGAMTTSAGPLRIGGNGVWGEFFNGLIDEVRIYSRALTQAEIQTDMGTPLPSGGTGASASSLLPPAE